jgi:SSS family solute:Na+ symporter
LLRAEDPSFEKNRDLGRDVFNVAVGIVWQVSMVALPIYLVIRNTHKMLLSLVVFVVTSVILKFTWYDKLGPGQMYLEEPKG